MRIITRSDTHYLQHSFRRGKQVVTRERRLGSKLPENLHEIKAAFLRACRKEAFYDTFDRIRAAHEKEWSAHPPSIKEKALQQLAIEHTYHTNAIEGSTITLEETRELVEHHMAPNRPLSDVKESEEHARLLRAVMESPPRLTKATLLRWHRQLFSQTKPDIAGRLREHLVRVGAYLAPDWQDLPQLLDELFSFATSSGHLHPVERAARLHYRFEKIHPFGDGNGRIGRLIITAVLWKERYPTLIIEYRRRRSYYQALKKDEEGFVQYFIRRYLAAHKRLAR